MSGFDFRRLGALLLASSSLTTVAAIADEAAQAPVEKIVVTGSIIDGNVSDDFGSYRTIVTDEQVRDLNALDLSSALRRTPGVTVSRFNTVGSFGGDEGGAIYIRGFGASRPGSEIKTYIEGVPFYMGVWSHPLLDLLPVNGMERITVYKGPQPQMFGNTFAAVDLTTRRAREEGTEGNIRIAGGSFGTFIEQADLVGRSGKWDYSLAQGFARSDGHRDDGDGQLLNAMLGLGYRINDNWSVSTTIIYADNDVSDPGQEGLPLSQTGTFETQGTFGVVSLNHSFEGVTGSVKLYANGGEGRWLDQPGLDGDTISKFSLYGVRWTEEITPWDRGFILAGVDYDVVTGDADFNRVLPAPSQVFDGPSLKILQPHVSVGHSFDIGNGWELVPSAGVRWYSHNVLEGETAPHAGLILRSDKVELRANYAKGVNYPGLDAAVLSDLIPALGTSWTDLKPETDDHIEFGLSYAPTSSTTIDVALFRDQLENRYIFAFPPTVIPPAFINLGAYDVTGAEASIQHLLTENWSVFAGVTVLDPSLATLPYAPEMSLSFGTTAEFHGWRLSVDAQHQSSMYVLNEARADGAVNTQQVDAFTVANVRLAYGLEQLGKRGEIYVAVENLFDAEYSFRPGYPMPGTSAQAGVNISF